MKTTSPHSGNLLSSAIARSRDGDNVVRESASVRFRPYPASSSASVRAPPRAPVDSQPCPVIPSSVSSGAQQQQQQQPPPSLLLERLRAYQMTLAAPQPHPLPQQLPQQQQPAQPQPQQPQQQPAQTRETTAAFRHMTSHQLEQVRRLLAAHGPPSRVSELERMREVAQPQPRGYDFSASQYARIRDLCRAALKDAAAAARKELAEQEQQRAEVEAQRQDRASVVVAAVPSVLRRRSSTTDAVPCSHAIGVVGSSSPSARRSSTADSTPTPALDSPASRAARAAYCAVSPLPGAALEQALAFIREDAVFARTKVDLLLRLFQLVRSIDPLMLNKVSAFRISVLVCINRPVTQVCDAIENSIRAVKTSTAAARSSPTAPSAASV